MLYVLVQSHLDKHLVRDAPPFALIGLRAHTHTHTLGWTIVQVRSAELGRPASKDLRNASLSILFIAKVCFLSFGMKIDGGQHCRILCVQRKACFAQLMSNVQG